MNSTSTIVIDEICRVLHEYFYSGDYIEGYLDTTKDHGFRWEQHYIDYHNHWMLEIGEAIWEHVDFLDGRHIRTMIAKTLFTDIFERFIILAKFIATNKLW